MPITLEQHRQSFINCIEAAILDKDVDLARSLLIECEVYGERITRPILTLAEVTGYYIDCYEIDTYTIYKLP